MVSILTPLYPSIASYPQGKSETTSINALMISTSYPVNSTMFICFFFIRLIYENYFDNSIPKSSKNKAIYISNRAISISSTCCFADFLIVQL